MSKLSSRSVVTTSDDGDFIHVIQDNGSGGFISRRISKINFLKELQAEVDALGKETQTITSGDQGSSPNYDAVITHTRGTNKIIVTVYDTNGNLINLNGVLFINNSGTSTTQFTLRIRESISGTWTIIIQ